MWIVGLWLVDARLDGESLVAVDRMRCAVVRIDPRQRSVELLQALDRFETHIIEEACPWRLLHSGPVRIVGNELSGPGFVRTLETPDPAFTRFLLAGSAILPEYQRHIEPLPDLPLRSIDAAGRDRFTVPVPMSAAVRLDADERLIAVLGSTMRAGGPGPTELSVFDANTGRLRFAAASPVGDPLGVDITGDTIVAFGERGASAHTSDGRPIGTITGSSWGATLSEGALVVGRGREVIAGRWRYALPEREHPPGPRITALGAGVDLVWLRTTSAVTALSAADGAVRWRWGLSEVASVEQAGRWLVITEPLKGTAFIDLEAPLPARSVTVRGRVQTSDTRLLPANLSWGERTQQLAADGTFAVKLEGRGLALLSARGGMLPCPAGELSLAAHRAIEVDLEGPAEIDVQIPLSASCTPIGP